eukprot:956127-Pleurochrysis_carterae.AAC.1
MGASGSLTEAYILARGAITIPYRQYGIRTSYRYRTASHRIAIERPGHGAWRASGPARAATAITAHRVLRAAA